MNEKKIQLDDTYMNVIQFGHGDRVLTIIAGVSLLGLEGQGEAVAQSYDNFADDYTVYLFDRRKVLPEGFTIYDMAEDIIRCLKELGVERTCVYGVSQGGMIAQVLAIKYPQLVEKLVICSSACRENEVLKKVIGRWIELASAGDVVGFNHQSFMDVYSPAFLEGVKDMLPQLEQMGTEEDCKRLLVELNACIGLDIYDQLENIDCPVLVMGDEQDKVLGIEGTYEIAEALGCDSYVYNGYSHAVYDEAPDIKNRVKQFLD